MTDEQLLEQLERQNLITPQLVSRLKRDALIKSKPAEAIIEEERIVPSEKIAELKSSLLNVPYQKIDPATVNQELLDLIPEETARNYGVVPLGLQDGLLVAGMVHPDDAKAQDALKFVARRGHYNLGVYVISYADWEAVLRKYSPYRTEIARAVQSIGAESSASAQKIVRLDDAAVGEEAPVIKIVADTLKEAVFSKASDVHIEPQENGVRIRFRIDGDLRQVALLPPTLGQPVISRVKVISSMKIDETRIPQDGRFRSRIMDKDIDFRVSTFPTPLGEKVAIRVLDPSQGLKNFESLPFQYKNREIVKAGLEKPYGMILITGPTGSGKTTTLYAFLQQMNQEDVNIVSLEDPVEYFVSGINQSQVRPEIGYDFASGLREIVRQDPDVIMVGEIRDAETAGLAVQAALTGHIVLSTLHTNNAAGVIPRLMDLKVEPFLLPVSLNLMIAQRLIGTLCPNCKAPEPAAGEVQQVIRRALADLPEEARKDFAEPYQVYHAKGCAACKGRGIQGRMAIYEVFRMTPEIEQLIAGGNLTIQKILAEARRQGMLTLRQDGVIKALRGLVSIEEVVRETEEV
ncbi:MAG: Flp pilus assembly complex ATPase component TadA [Patescibacteria group bacterium]|nr:Flp pilus assembly complex ATPase component TadA [Patescibacteria group bacterium]